MGSFTISAGGYIHLRKALSDYLKEQDVTLSALLGAMDKDSKGAMEALQERVHLSEAQSRALQLTLRSRDPNLLLFVVQAFYLLNPSDMYKGLIVEPFKSEVVWEEKATFEGCKRVLKALRIAAPRFDA